MDARGHSLVRPFPLHAPQATTISLEPK